MFWVTKPCFDVSKKIKTLKQKEIKITPLPMIPTRDLDNDFLASPFNKHPARGRRGTR